MDASTTNPAGTRLTFRKRCVFAAVPLLILLAVTELVARWFVSPSVLAKRYEQIEQIIVFLGNQPGESIFEPDPKCFWRLKPNVVAPAERGTWWGGVMSNNHGMRSREVSIEECQDKLRVLCLGDSTTFGFGVDFADTWPNQLQAMLGTEFTSETQITRSVSKGFKSDRTNAPSLTRRASFEAAAPNVEVLNAGIPGHTTFQGRTRLEELLNQWHPQLTVITYGNNDGWRWDGLADKEHARRTIHQTTAWLEHSRAWQCLRSWRMQATREEATRDESQWAEQVSWNYLDPNLNWTPRVSLQDFADNLRAMLATCREHHSEVVLIVWPDQRQLLTQPTWRLPYQAVTRQVAEESGVAFVDLVPPFEQAGQWGIDRFLPRDVIHVDRAGNRLVSNEVLPHVRHLLAHKVALRLDAHD